MDLYLEKLTVVIFSYNRQEYLKRTIKFWSSYSVNVLVLDGSDNKLDDIFLQKKNIKYIYDKRSLYDRLLETINHINTEFMILSCDDEFYLPSALSTCVKFLSNQNTYSSCKGTALGFFSDNKKKIICARQIYQELLGIHLYQDNASDRIKKHFYNYTIAHLFSVTRTHQWKIICKHVFEKEYNFYAVWELQIEFLLMVSGKSKIIPELMWMRNIEVPRIRNTSPSMAYLEISDWWNNDNYKLEKKNFLFRMKNACNEILIDQNSKFTEDEIEKLFEIYINRFYTRKKSLIRKIVDLIPVNVKRCIKSILNWEKFILKKRQMTFNNARSLEEEANLLKKRGIFVNYKEINLIISAIQNH